MECAGNTRAARFGMISVGQWTGVPISEILAYAKGEIVRDSGSRFRIRSLRPPIPPLRRPAQAGSSLSRNLQSPAPSSPRNSIPCRSRATTALPSVSSFPIGMAVLVSSGSIRSLSWAIPPRPRLKCLNMQRVRIKSAVPAWRKTSFPRASGLRPCRSASRNGS